MEWFRVIAIGLVGMTASVLLRQYKPEYAPLLSLTAGLAMIVMLVSGLHPVFAELTQILSLGGVRTDYLTVLIKSLGICYVSQLAADSCRDAGESAIAGKMELAGKTAVLVLGLPYFVSMLQMIGRLICL